MFNRRKVSAVGLSATLLASLFATALAPIASAAVTVTSAGTIPTTGTSSGTAAFTFTERADPNDITDAMIAAGSELTVTILDSAGANTLSFSGTPTVSAPGSLGATVTVSANTLNINFTGHDPLNAEPITVSGLTITSSGAAVGPARALLTGNAASAYFVPPTTTTVSGTLAADLPAGGGAVNVNLTSPCAFAVTGGNTGLAQFSDVADARSVTAVGAPAAGVQSVTFAPGTVLHPSGTTVTQVADYALACPGLNVLGSPATVVASLAYNAVSPIASVFPGEANQPVTSLTATEPAAGFLSVGTTITFTINTAGVTFSNVPELWVSAGTGLVLGAPTLSADRKSVSATVTTASTATSTITLGDNPATAAFNGAIRYDVASTVPSGTLVGVTLSLSGGKLVTPASRNNAQVGRIFTATAPTPNVSIGQNAQTAGLITITEVGAGSFTAGTGGNNVFEICLDSTASFTSPGPVATVTGGVAAGNLILREGAGASPDNIVPGTPDPAAPGCYYWTVFTASTTAATITIGSSGTAGPLVNVAQNVAPGPLNATLSAGRLDDPATPANERSLVAQVTLAIANRVFASQVAVSAASQPIIAPGATHALAGNLIIQETANGQLKNGTFICVEIVPNQQTNFVTDVFLSSLNTADLPVATATNGVIVGPVMMSQVRCDGTNAFGTSLSESFSVQVLQQSTTGNGRVTISNIHYTAVNDAASGPVQVNVQGRALLGAPGGNIDFQRIVSNAVIGNPIAGTAATRIGVTQVGAFTTSTKVVRRGNYVTYRFDFGTAAAGDRVQIWAATKTGNDWSAFAVVTTRIANSSGVVYYHIRQGSAVWKSYRGFWIDGGSWTPARQARWI